MSSNLPPDANVGRLPVDLRPRRLILLPYNDLNINQGRDDQFPIDPRGFQLGLVLPYGLGPTEPKVFTMDAAGSLQVTTAGQTAPGSVSIRDDPAQTTNIARVVGGVTTSVQPALAVAVGLDGHGGSLVEWSMGTASTLTPGANIPGALVASPGEWAAFSNAGLGIASSAGRVAGAAGVRHIVVGYHVIISCQAAPGAGNVIVNIRDGAAGAGTILEQLQVGIPAAVFPPIVISRSGLSMVGSTATAFTIEQSAAYAAVQASINFEGYDVS